MIHAALVAHYWVNGERSEIGKWQKSRASENSNPFKPTAVKVSHR